MGRFDRVITHAPGQPRTGPAEEDVSDKPVFIRSTPEATPAQRRGKGDGGEEKCDGCDAVEVWHGGGCLNPMVLMTMRMRWRSMGAY
jgi:hypothetical protein